MSKAVSPSPSDIPSENMQLIFKDKTNRGMEDGNYRTLRIIHFNDVYNIDGSSMSEQQSQSESHSSSCGGAARFATVLDYLNQIDQDHLILFSGDAFSPSTLSLFAKGKQMVEVLNKFKIHAAVIGNHEFDMGLDVMDSLLAKCTFPWMLSNVLDVQTKKPLMGLDQKLVVNMNGIKIGLIGLAEKEWVSSLSAINFDDLIYEPFVAMARKLATELKTEDKCDIVIALTHMLWGNDEKLIKKVPQIDLVLGGHDHDYGVRKVQDKWLIKSGTDFRELSRIKLIVDSKNQVHVKKIIKINIDSKIPEKQEIKQIVEKYIADADRALDEQLGVINTSMDGRSDSVRQFETNLGNFLCDIILSAVSAECAILNGGSLRSNSIHPAGVFKRRDLRSILPFGSELIVVSMTGSELHQMLENCVAKYGEGGGRYPQISGLFFAFDPRKPAGQRINPKIIKVQDKYIQLDRSYLVASNTFLSSVDPVMKRCKVVTTTENIPFLYTLVENHFKAIDTARSSHSSHAANLVPRVIIDSIVKKLAADPEVHSNNVSALMQKEKTGNKLTFKMAALVVIKTLHMRKVLLSSDRRAIKSHEKFKEQMRKYEEKCLRLAPQVEGRSLKITDDSTLESLLADRELWDLKIKQSDSSNSLNQY